MKKNTTFRVFLIAGFLLVFTPTFLFSQGIIQGVVSDSTSREALVGANVLIVGTAMGGVTDIDGKFRITNVPAGSYRVRLSYLGFVTKFLRAEVEEGKTVVLNGSLTPDVIEGNEVLITAQARGQIAAINQQLTSKSIVNVVSEEKIKELPDANAAELIGRLPGVSLIRSGGEASRIVLRGLSSKFSNITVDGVKIPSTDPNTRDVDLSTISQGFLSGVELYKTLTPDQDADAIAGTVNLVTRRAPVERTITFDVKGNYNRLMESAKQYDVTGKYGERFFDDILGVQFQANAEKKIRSRENITYAYRDVNAATSFWEDYTMTSFTVDFTDEERLRNGMQVIFDVDTPDSGSVKLTGIYSGTTRNILLNNRIYPGSGGNALWDYNYRYTEQGINTVNTSLQGNNSLAGLDVHWSASYAHSKIDNPFDFAIRFTDPSGALPGGVPSGRDLPELNLIPYASNNFFAATCSTGRFFSRENFDKERTAFLNVTKKYNAFDLLSGELKVGGKYKDRSRWMVNQEFDDNTYLHGFGRNVVEGIDSIRMMQSRFGDYYNNRSSDSPSLTDFFDAPASSRNLFGLYQMIPLLNKEVLEKWYDLTRNGTRTGSPLYVPNAQATLADYLVNEKVTSGYIMNTLNYGQEFTMIAGVRIEHETNDYLAKFTPGGISNIGIILTASDPIVDSTTNYSETIILPNLQFTFRPTEYLNIRLAAYKALARPDYNLRLPGYYLYAEDLTLGNPNLKDTKAWNYEVNTQIYTNTVGLISVSVFYKEMDDLYHQMTGVLIDSELDSLLDAVGMTWHRTEPFSSRIHTSSKHTLNLPYNSKQKSYAWGLEFEHQLNFNFLPGYLSNITLSYNVSITRSSTYIIGNQTLYRTDTIPPSRPGNPPTIIQTAYHPPHERKTDSEGQPRLYGNVAVGYDIFGLSARLSVFYQDEFVQQYSQDGQTDIIVDSFVKMDLALKQKISESISLFLNINNLTNQKESTSLKNNSARWQIPRTAELYGTTADLGVRISL